MFDTIKRYDRRQPARWQGDGHGRQVHRMNEQLQLELSGVDLTPAQLEVIESALCFIATAERTGFVRKLASRLRPIRALGRVLITPRGDSPRGQVDVAHHPDCHSRNESYTGEHSRYYGRAEQNHS